VRRHWLARVMRHLANATRSPIKPEQKIQPDILANGGASVPLEEKILAVSGVRVERHFVFYIKTNKEEDIHFRSPSAELLIFHGFGQRAALG